MRSKAPLVLIEQMVMLLVLALASALCLQAFVKSDAISVRSEEKGRAAIAAQNAAEVIRHKGGDIENAFTQTGRMLGGTYEQGELRIDYDENWNVTDKDGVYYLIAQEVPAQVSGLRKASVQVATDAQKADPGILFELEVAWQEVDADE